MSIDNFSSLHEKIASGLTPEHREIAEEAGRRIAARIAGSIDASGDEYGELPGFTTAPTTLDTIDSSEKSGTFGAVLNANR